MSDELREISAYLRQMLMNEIIRAQIELSSCYNEGSNRPKPEVHNQTPPRLYEIINTTCDTLKIERPKQKQKAQQYKPNNMVQYQQPNPWDNPVEAAAKEYSELEERKRQLQQYQPQNKPYKRPQTDHARQQQEWKTLTGNGHDKDF